MVDREISEAFNDCLERINAGQSVDSCLRLYPQYAAILRPMLETGQVIRRMLPPQVEVSTAQARARVKFQAALRSTPQRRPTPLPRLLPLAAAFLIAIFVVVGGTAAVSQNSLPGDALYGVKRLTESIGLALDQNPALVQQYNQRRIDEINQLLAVRRVATVEFQGIITQQSSDVSIIAGLTVQIDPQTQRPESLQIGDTVHVEAYTTPTGELVAVRLTLLVESPRLPATTSTATIAPTATTQPSATFTPSQTTSPQPTATPTQTAAPSLTPTATPTPSPSPTPSITASLTSTTGPTQCVPTPPAGWVNYTIQSGDTVSGLASSRGITIEQLLTANCLTDPRRIIAGQTIFLPPAPQNASPTQGAGPGDTGSGSNSNQNGNDSGDQSDNNGSDDHSGSNNNNDDDDDNDNDD
jgi:LysM repeat protein